MLRRRIYKWAAIAAVLLLVIVSIRGVYLESEHRKKISQLHNEIALKSKTIEVKDGIYKKATLEIENLSDALKAMEDQADNDKKKIKELRKEIDKKRERILSASRTIIKWKKAYEGEVNAEQDDVGSHDGGEDAPKRRTKVSFDKNFGYVSVDGFTLTNPAYAKLRIEQNRPLILTMAITQSKDKRWNTYVVSSEDGVEIDVNVSAVNPFLFSKKWYEKISVVIGAEVSSGFYPYLGILYPLGPVSFSAGGFYNSFEKGFGPYLRLEYSWSPFSRK